MTVSKTDERAIRLMASMKRADLRQSQIDKLVEEAGGCIVTAVMKGYNAGFLSSTRRCTPTPVRAHMKRPLIWPRGICWQPA